MLTLKTKQSEYPLSDTDPQALTMFAILNRNRTFESSKQIAGEYLAFYASVKTFEPIVVPVLNNEQAKEYINILLEEIKQLPMLATIVSPQFLCYVEQVIEAYDRYTANQSAIRKHLDD